MPQTPLNIPLGAHSSPAITANGNTQVKTGPGVLMGVSVLVAGTAWTMNLYDGTSAAGSLLGVINMNTPGPIEFPPLAFKTGLFVVAAGTTAGQAKVNFF